jgi:thioredoxin-like negative regulator of GroEL
MVFWLAFAIPQLAESAAFRRLSVESVDREHLFQSAQNEYLKGNWFQAETLFGRLIQLDAQDVEAQLYLATMNRHIDRIDEAQQKLDELASVSAARRWQWEMGQERQLLARRKRELVAERSTAVDAA